VGFFDARRSARDELDDDEEIDEPRAAYVGGVVPVTAIIARTATAAVAVRGIVAYPDGFELHLAAWVRRQRRSAPRRGRANWGLILLDASELDDNDTLPAEFLRFGIQFPDGASITNLDTRPWDLSPDATEPPHGMEPSSGGGSDSFYEQEWWVWPLPDEGALTFICEWPAHDIAETRYEIDANDIRQAATRAQPIWPDLAGPSRLTHSQLIHHISTTRLRSTEGSEIDP